MDDEERTPPGEVTRLLVAADAGDSEALDRLVPLVYEDLRRVAHRQLDREGGGHTLQTTALIHEGLPEAGRRGLPQRQQLRWATSPSRPTGPPRTSSRSTRRSGGSTPGSGR